MMIATDKEAAIKEMVCKAGELFDAWEYDKDYSEAVNNKTNKKGRRT